MPILQLGCGVYSVYIADRSGDIKIRELPFSSLHWTREQDNVSLCELTLRQVDGGPNCCRYINGLFPWAYEIGVYRDSERVWTGPVTHISTNGGDVSITARDKMAWLFRRHVHNEHLYPDPGADLATIFNEIIVDAMAVDNVPNLVPTATATGRLGARSYYPNKIEKAWEAVDELCRTGVDFTMIDSTMVAGSFEIPANPIAYLTAQAFADPPDIEIDGMDQANVWYVGPTGSPGTTGFPFVGFFGAVDPDFGVLEDSVVEDKIEDQDSANTAASTRWDLTHDPVINVNGGTLDVSAPMSVDLLVPGTVIRLAYEETCYPLTRDYRLSNVDVKVDVGDGISEVVEVEFQPVGTTDEAA